MRTKSHLSGPPQAFTDSTRSLFLPLLVCHWTRAFKTTEKKERKQWCWRFYQRSRKILDGRKEASLQQLQVPSRRQSKKPRSTVVWWKSFDILKGSISLIAAEKDCPTTIWRINRGNLWPEAHHNFRGLQEKEEQLPKYMSSTSPKDVQ